MARPSLHKAASVGGLFHFRRTEPGIHPRTKSEGRLFRDHALTAQESVRLAVAKIKILVGVVQKNVVVIDADGLAKTRLIAHLAAYALRIGARRKYQGGGQCANGSGSGSRHDRDRTHELVTLEN
jgi:hypothetical protein